MVMTGAKIKDVEDNEKGIRFTISKEKLQEMDSKMSHVRDPGFLIDATFGDRFLFGLSLHRSHKPRNIVQLTLRNLLKVAVSLDCTVAVVGPMGNTEEVVRHEFGPDSMLNLKMNRIDESQQVSVGVPDLFCGTVGDVQVAVRVRACEVVKTHALGRMRARLGERKEKDAKEAKEAQATLVTEEKTPWNLDQVLEDLGEQGIPKGKEKKSEKKKKKQEKKDNKLAEQADKLKINVDLVKDERKVVEEKPRRREEASPQALGASPRTLPVVVARLVSQLGAAGAPASQQVAGSGTSNQPGAASAPASRPAAPSKAQRKVEKVVRLLEGRRQLAHLPTPSLHRLVAQLRTRLGHLSDLSLSHIEEEVARMAREEAG